MFLFRNHLVWVFFFPFQRNKYLTNVQDTLGFTKMLSSCSQPGEVMGGEDS